MTMTDAAAPRGLKGVIVADTELGDVRGLEGFYHYRQYSAPELAAVRTFEDVWYLLFEGELPDARRHATRTPARIAAARHLPPEVADAPPRTGGGPPASAGGVAHRAVAARRGRGHAARPTTPIPRPSAPTRCGWARRRRCSSPALHRASTRARAGRAARRPRSRRQLPLDDRRRGARSASRPCRRAVPDPRHRPRLQRVDVHRARRDVDRRRRRCGGRRRARRAVGSAARRCTEPRARHARRHRHARPHRGVGARRGRRRRPHHGVRARGLPDRRSALGDAPRHRPVARW